MKKYFTFLIVAIANILAANAQSSERRNTLQMQVSYEGRTVTTELNSLNTSITRYAADEAPAKNEIARKDSAATKMPTAATSGSANDSFYLSMEAKSIRSELLRILAARHASFDGSVTIKDTFGKNPDRRITFKGARLYSYSDQFAGVSYNDQYGSAVLSIACTELSIDGVPFRK